MFIGKLDCTLQRIYSGASVGQYLISVHAFELFDLCHKHPGAQIPQIRAVMDDFGFLVPVKDWS